MESDFDDRKEKNNDESKIECEILWRDIFM